MIIEDLLLGLIFLVSFFIIYSSVYKAYKLVVKKKPVDEARVRLQQAQEEVEAARLNREAEKLYDELYREAIKEDKKENENK